jgi:hypothetical protein
LKYNIIDIGRLGDNFKVHKVDLSSDTIYYNKHHQKDVFSLSGISSIFVFSHITNENFEHFITKLQRFSQSQYSIPFTFLSDYDIEDFIKRYKLIYKLERL